MTNDVIEALPFPVLMVNASGGIDVANPAAHKLLGNAIRGRHYITVLRQPSVLDAVETALNTKTVSVANYLATVARSDVTLEMICTPLPSGSVLMVFEDKTALHEAGQMRRNFVANVSHELRTPLTALLGFIETLRGAARDDAVARDRFLQIMESEANRMNRLVADLLSLNRVEEEARVRPTQNVDLARIAQSVLNSVTPLAEERSLSFSTKGLESAANLPGDADQLSQVVTNLIENAIKYSEHFSTVKIDLQYEPENRMLMGPVWVLSVSDTGEGIDAKHIPRLTERFYRIDTHRSRKMGGTGLGLAIVKHIINRHRGRFKIQSDLGKGSVFTVILPAQV